MDIAFTDLKEKEIINVNDGKKLGHIIDFLFDIESGQVKGVVVPGSRKIFRKAEDIFIPLEKIRKIGGDVILVKLRVFEGNENFNIQRVENSFKTKYNLKNYYDSYKSNGVNNLNNMQTIVRYNANNNASNKVLDLKRKRESQNGSFVRFKPINNIKYKWLAKPEKTMYYWNKRKSLWSVYIVVQKKAKLLIQELVMNQIQLEEEENVWVVQEDLILMKPLKLLQLWLLKVMVTVSVFQLAK